MIWENVVMMTDNVPEDCLDEKPWQDEKIFL